MAKTTGAGVTAAAMAGDKVAQRRLRRLARKGSKRAQGAAAVAGVRIK